MDTGMCLKANFRPPALCVCCHHRYTDACDTRDAGEPVHSRLRPTRPPTLRRGPKS